MTHRHTPCFFPCLAVMAGLIMTTQMTMTVQAEPIVPVPGFPQSAGVQMKTHNFTVENLRTAHEMGFRVVRRAFYWQGVEQEKGVYDFSKWDTEMAEADRLGLTVIGCWFGNNKLHEDDGRGGIQTEEGRQAFAAFAAACAKRYKDQKVLWEVWNEPNVRTFWRKDGKHNSDEFAQEYTDLVKAIMPAVLAVDPDAFVIAGSVSNYWKPSYEWTEACFKNGMLDTGIKAWSTHPYGLKTPEEFTVGHTITRELLKKYGKPAMPILNTERGFAIKELKNNEGWSGGNKDQVFAYQAWHFVRQYMADQMNGVPITIWYEWDGKDPWTGSAFALFNDEPRPIIKAAEVMLDQLNGYNYVRRIDTGYPLDFLLLFRNEAGEQKLVAWTAPPAGDTPDAAFAHEVKIELNTGGPATATGLLGDELNVAEAGENAYRLAVSGAPQYVVVPSGADISAASIEPYRAPIEEAKAPPPNAIDLKLFASEDHWDFQPNTGDGLFEVNPNDERDIGVLHYNFTQAKAQGTPYVLATATTKIEKAASAVIFYARSPVRQQLTFRLVDSTGQTHQFKKRIDGIDQWERIDIPLTRRLEHWGGAKDGTIHYPIESIVLAVPLPGEEIKHGKVEYSHAMVVPE